MGTSSAFSHVKLECDNFSEPEFLCKEEFLLDPVSFWTPDRAWPGKPLTDLRCRKEPTMILFAVIEPAVELLASSFPENPPVLAWSLEQD
jgi:hypothetical protein